MTTTDSAVLGGKPNEGTKKDKRLKDNASETETVETFAPMMSGMSGDAETFTADSATTQWRGVLVVEGTPTGDGREFATDSLSWVDTATVTMPLQWQKESSHGGDHDVTVAVGRIDRVWRDGALIYGEGRFDTHADAAEAQRRMGDQMLNGVSINADDITDADVEYVWDDEDNESEDDGDIISLLFASPKKIIFHSARMRAATLCDIPAYVEATLHTIDGADGGTVVAAAALIVRAAVSVHESELSSEAWDGAAQEARLAANTSPAAARAAYAFVDTDDANDYVKRDECRFLHHEISDTGVPGPANISACTAVINAVHGSRIPEHEKEAVYNHLAAHLEAAGQKQPPFEPQHALVAHAWHDTYRPKRDWFNDPEIKVPTPITVTDSGQVYGLATEWGVCHLGYQGECILPPREDFHSYYLTGSQSCDDGTSVAVGQITAGIGHASLTIGSWQRAAEHYDNTEAVVADIVTGNCKAGIWVAGAIRPSAQAARVQALRASGQVSPDWRMIGGQLRLVGMLTVNVSGFQVPRVRTYVSASGKIEAMIASGLVSVHTSQPTDAELDQRALRLLSSQLAARVHGKD
jgi:hypothetical protein